MSRRVSDDSNHRRNPIDLVKLFYEEKIDFKELLSQRQSSRKRTHKQEVYSTYKELAFIYNNRERCFNKKLKSVQ